MRNKSGFTLMEIMIVIVILGILASLALPKFTLATEKAKAQHGLTAARQLYAAQKIYQIKKDAYTATIADLETETLNPLYFTSPLIDGNIATVTTCVKDIARVNGGTFAYNFDMNCDTGVITCQATASSDGEKLCKALADNISIKSGN